MPFHFFFIFVLFIDLSVQLVCRQGSRVLNGSTCVAPDGGDCIIAKYPLSTEIPIPGIEVYGCGYCQDFQVNPLFTNVSCCNSSDLCGTIGPEVDATTCDAIDNGDACISRADCFWCEGSLLNVGICKPQIYFPLPCFTYSLLVPPPICASIRCPPVIPAYNATVLTRAYLDEFGLPNITDPTTGADLSVPLGLDISTRFDVRYLDNSNRSFCQVDQDLILWCGVNSTLFPDAFTYCIVAESWPQPDLQGWLRNTSFTGNKGLNILFPAFCACPNPGRGYYVKEKLIRAQAYYSAICPVENTLLAFYLILLILATTVFIAVIFDTGFLIMSQFQKRSGVTKQGAKTLAAKICIIFYFLVAIPCICIWLSPSDNTTQSNVGFVLKLLSNIFVLFSYCVSIFTFCEIILESGAFGKPISLTIFKWTFLLFSALVLICNIIMNGVSGFYYQAILDRTVTNIGTLQTYAYHTDRIAQASTLTLNLLAFIMFLVSGILLLYTTIVIFNNIEKMSENKMIKQLVVRDFSLIGATLSGFIYVALWLASSWIAVWVYGKNIESPFLSEYRTVIAMQWIFWALFMSELLLVTFIAFSMRTVVNHGLIYNKVKSIFGGSSGTGMGSAEIIGGNQQL